MEIKNLYKYEREGGGTTVSPVMPDLPYQLMYRLIANEGKAITNGEIVTCCIDVESAEGWTDCEFEEENEEGD